MIVSYVKADLNWYILNVPKYHLKGLQKLANKNYLNAYAESIFSVC